MSSNNQNNSNRREKDNKKFSNSQKDSTPVVYEPELMDAEDSLMEIKTPLGKAEKNANYLDKMVDTVFLKIIS